MFCPYAKTSAAYDETRKPLGIPCTLGAFATHPTKVLKEQRFVDIGGGTGTFMAEVRGKFGSATLFEYDSGMLKEAAARLSGTGVACMQGSADNLSELADGSFDAATMNQVIHHFPTDDNYAFLLRVFREVFRVLAPGGALVLNVCTHEQHDEAYWWFHFMPKACQAYKQASPPVPLCIEYMRNAGFSVDEGEIYTPLDGTLMAKDLYLKRHKLEGAFVQSYRDGDSGFTMGEKTGEIEAMHAEIRRIQAAGQEDQWIADAEKKRRAVGQATFVTARKPL